MFNSTQLEVLASLREFLLEHNVLDDYIDGISENHSKQGDITEGYFRHLLNSPLIWTASRGDSWSRLDSLWLSRDFPPGYIDIRYENRYNICEVLRHTPSKKLKLLRMLKDI